MAASRCAIASSPWWKWMTKCSVGSVRNLSDGSNRLAAARFVDAASSSARATPAQAARLERRTPSVPGRLAGDVLQEREVGNRQDVDSGEVAPRDRRVGLAPQADVRRLFGDDSLNLG